MPNRRETSVDGLRHHKEYVESQKKAWAKATANLPDNAFADDVKLPDPVGTFKTKPTHVVTATSGYEDG
jgi:hypothetical protein